MDELLKGPNPLRTSSFPVIRFIFAVVVSLPIIPILIVATFIRDWFIGGDSLTTLFGGFQRADAGLVQRAASKTAVMVAAARYVGFREGWTNDSLSRHFIPWEVVKAIDYTRSFSIGFPVSLRYSGYLMARTLAGDRLIENAKPKQIILLGAGLDTRAHRLRLSKDCRFYEIDIASTQAMKRRIADAHADEFNGKVEYISVDFANESFIEKLVQSGKGFLPDCPQTVVLFEGVSMYLPWKALKATMEMISQNLAPGTIVGMDFMDDFFTSDEARKRQRLYLGARELARGVTRVGEPFQWGMPVGEHANTIFPKLGFEVVADVTAQDMERLFFTPVNSKKPIGRAPSFVHYVILKVANRMPGH